MANKSKILKILETQFGDDPVVLRTVYSQYVKESEDKRKQDNEDHRREIAEVKSLHKQELDAREKREEARHVAALKAIQEAKDTAISVAKSEVSASKALTSKTLDESIESLEKKLGKKYDERLKNQGKNIERLTEFAVGAPNRSLYLNGTIISGRYSDVNFIPGSGITMSETDNETTHQADFTINATGGGGGFTQLTATGAVNSVNRAFTFTQKPTYIVSDGAWYTQLDNNGNAQWSWDGVSTATMVIPPNASIYGVA